MNPTYGSQSGKASSRLTALAAEVARRAEAEARRQQEPARQQAEAARAATEAEARLRRELAERKAKCEQLYALYQQVRSSGQATASEVMEAWLELGRELGVQVPAYPGELEWESDGVRVKELRLDVAARERPYENSLGMRFVPVLGTDALFSIWLTRVQDYKVFVNSTNRTWELPGFPQDPTHPAVRIDWFEASSFCDWLTQQERCAGRLPDGARYRLPSDREWSDAVGLDEPIEGTPKAKKRKAAGRYPWGRNFPPPQGAGNYHPNRKVDDFEHTSPVGSFAANQFGIFDLGGNVWEWCEDCFDEDKFRCFKVLRGASYADYEPDRMLSSYRNCNLPHHSDRSIGFRCVLAESPNS